MPRISSSKRGSFSCGHPYTEDNSYQNPSKVSPECRKCWLSYAENWRAANPERAQYNKRNWAFRKKYGITDEEYQGLVEHQKGLCATCGLPTEKLQIDHDHETGIRRMLLCRKCNNMLGYLEKYPQLVPVLQEYMAFFKEEYA